jgi:hypothetical protein
MIEITLASVYVTSLLLYGLLLLLQQQQQQQQQPAAIALHRRKRRRAAQEGEYWVTRVHRLAAPPRRRRRWDMGEPKDLRAAEHLDGGKASPGPLEAFVAPMENVVQVIDRMYTIVADPGQRTEMSRRGCEGPNLRVTIPDD